MNRTGWTVVVVAVVIVIVAAGFEVATRSSRVPVSAAGQQRAEAGDAAPSLPTRPAELPDRPDGGVASTTDRTDNDAVAMAGEVEGLRTLSIDLYFVRPDGQGLSPVRTEIFATAALLDRLKQTVSALIRGPGPNSPLDPVLPAGTPLRDLYLDKAGILYIDFGQELISMLPSGSAAEVQAAGALANTLVLNFAEVRKVRILVAGEEIRTLGGHLDLTLPLAADPGLVRPWIAQEEWWWPGWLAARIIETRDAGVLSSVATEGEVP